MSKKAAGYKKPKKVFVPINQVKLFMKNCHKVVGVQEEQCLADTGASSANILKGGRALSTAVYRMALPWNCYLGSVILRDAEALSNSAMADPPSDPSTLTLPTQF